VVLPEMIEPIAEGIENGFVPLCCALHWIMTSGGTRAVTIDDSDGWTRAVEKLLPHIHAEDIELIGLPRTGSLSEKIPGHALATIKVLMPFRIGSPELLEARSHIDTCVFIDQEHWSQNLNDKLYEKGQPSPTWTQLQVRKDQVLLQWPRPAPTSSSETGCVRWLLAEIKKSPERRSRPKEQFKTEAQRKFPGLADRQFERAWQKAIGESGATAWSRHGPIPRSDRRGT
jgi:hypothetical protein